MKLPSERQIVLMIAAIGIAALLWLIAIAAYARSMSNSDCSRISQDMGVIAQMRDRQADQTEVEQMVDRVLREHLGEPDSYIQVETDITFMVGMVQVIYGSKLSAADIERAAFSTCHQYGYGVGYKL